MSILVLFSSLDIGNKCQRIAKDKCWQTGVIKPYRKNVKSIETQNIKVMI